MNNCEARRKRYSTKEGSGVVNVNIYKVVRYDINKSDNTLGKRVTQITNKIIIGRSEIYKRHRNLERLAWFFR